MLSPLNFWQATNHTPLSRRRFVRFLEVLDVHQ
jgi:hypothetical protein